MINLRITSRDVLPRAFVDFDCKWALSIQDAAEVDEPLEIPVGIDEDKHAHFFFDDIREEFASHPSTRNSLIIRAQPPKMSDVREILNFAKRIPSGDRVLIHCHAGISRSTASAFAIHVAFGAPVGTAFRLMLDNSFGARPNELIVRYADELIGKNGEMIAYLEKWKKENPSEFSY